MPFLYNLEAHRAGLQAVSWTVVSGSPKKLVKVRNYLSVLAFEKKTQCLTEKYSIQYNYYSR